MDSVATPENTEAFELYQELIRQIGLHNSLFLIIGKTLKRFRDEKLFLSLGVGGYDNFREFFSDPEIKIKYKTGLAYIGVYEYYVQRLGIEEDKLIQIPVNRLIQVKAKLLEKPDNEAKELIESLGFMNHKDYRATVREQGLETDRPHLFKDETSGLWIFEFQEHQVAMIINQDTKELIYKNKDYDKKSGE